MQGDKYLKWIATFLATAGFFALMGVTCGKAHAGCYEALVIDRAYSVDRPEVASGGDVVAVRACGWAWGKKEKVAPFRVEGLEAASDAEAAALVAPLLNADGSTARERRFYFDGTTLRDRKDGAAVTPPEAKARVNADALEVHTLAPPF